MVHWSQGVLRRKALDRCELAQLRSLLSLVFETRSKDKQGGAGPWSGMCMIAMSSQSGF